ncbi:ROK family transcriptional regulator [Streptomyces sp. CA-210063]|uniref:ROK family transcriptional regulator n=1 Tax=Streptomyces sp. CA-210063 TaxID=2801029 RepID=UPI00214B8CEF|nr:ROK family transcriptional regulator [Streptomyces sp. CA-210063]UUU35284.1 ROK family transcriptional regulator [Streptomyces sp. CA-210063]
MPASPSTARAINDRLALRLLQQEGPLTAGRLKQLTGLSRPTVADLVERLGAAGLIEVVGESGEQRRGPNARLYGIVAGRAHLAALDVRTEGVTVVVADLLGTELARASVPIADDTGTGPAVEQAVTLVERTAKEAGADRLHTVAIGAPGLIDPATGELRNSTGLPEWHRRLVAALGERLPARVLVENETNLAALAEQRDGVARDRDTFVLLWLGLGTGAAVVLDGHLRRGASGGTGEIGFLPVPGTTAIPSATDCEGGFHSLGGAAAVAALAAEHGVTATGEGHEPHAAALVRAAVAGLSGGWAAASANRPGLAVGGSVGAVGGSAGLVGGSVGAVGGSAGLVGGSVGAVGGSTGLAGGSAGAVGGSTGTVGGAAGGECLSAETRKLSAEAGSPSADGTHPSPPGTRPSAAPAPSADPNARFLDALADRLAIGAASVVAVLDPGCVVLGGEVGQAGGDVLAARVEARLTAMSPLPTEVRPSGLGGAAVLRGALLMAREAAQDELFAPAPR